MKPVLTMLPPLGLVEVGRRAFQQPDALGERLRLQLVAKLGVHG